MMHLLTGKTAIITGGAQGIGRGIAERFAAEGASVAIADINIEKAENTADEIAKQSGRICRAYHTDVTGESDIAATIDRVRENFGYIDILINNAGVQPASQYFWEIGQETWDKTFQLDLRSVFLFSKLIIPLFFEQKKGCIVNTSSIAGLFLWEKCAHYIVAKSAIITLTKAMALELAPYAIRVNAVAPGHVDTELNRPSLLIPGTRERFNRQVPLNRMALPGDLAGAFAFLASDNASGITGSVIYVDGGLTQIK
jgi:NAD(P)-dependent dehydrogenase (short-subunit alcohol dehydrogenase family)